MYLRLADAEDFEEMRAEETQLIWFTLQENDEISMAGLEQSPGEKWRLYYEKNNSGGKGHIILNNTEPTLNETNRFVLKFNQDSNQIECSEGKLEVFDYTPVVSISPMSAATFFKEE